MQTKIPRSYIQDTETGKLDPIGEKGMLAVLPSPDGRSVLIDDPLGSYLVWPLDGGKPMPIDGLTSEDRPIQWSPDGKFLYLRGPEAAVLRIYRYNLANGQRQLWKTVAPVDPAGLIGIASGRGELAMTPGRAGLRVHVLDSDAKPVSRRGIVAVTRAIAPLDSSRRTCIE